MPLPPSYLAGNRGIVVRGVQRRPSALYHQAWVNPVASATNSFKTTVAGPNTTTISYYRTGFVPQGNVVFDGTRADGILDFARNCVITVTHGSAVVAESGTITGRDIYNQVQTEAWSVTAGGTSKTFTGKKTYIRVDTVTITAVADASANSNVIGHGNVFGLEVRSSLGTVAGLANAALKEVVDGAIATNGLLAIASSASTDEPRGSYAPNTAPDGAHDYEIAFVSDDPELSG